MQPTVNVVVLSRSHKKKGFYPGALYQAMKMNNGYLVKSSNTWYPIAFEEIKEVEVEKPKLTLYEVYKKLNMKISLYKYGVAL